MIYVRSADKTQADRALTARGFPPLSEVGNIDKSGSVRGMRELYGWPKGGQVRVGGYIYNVGPLALQALRDCNLTRGG